MNTKSTDISIVVLRLLVVLSSEVEKKELRSNRKIDWFVDEEKKSKLAFGNDINIDRTKSIGYLSCWLFYLLSITMWKRRTSEFDEFEHTFIFKTVLGESKDPLLLSCTCRSRSTNSSNWLLWRFSEIYWVRLAFFSISDCHAIFFRTFGFDHPCESVHFQKTRLLFYQAENDLCLAMVRSCTRHDCKREVFIGF